ncbi:MFS transporter [Paenibacillus nasutitermitis]|uniref:Major facilitator superfamily (MFS) profile domain-containing protein n=1 Tax=Paenibacillus nasutitermitis TaxID=1652958 RepID=A0A916YM01_9BACL|nr:MFS transporter [Paenibacillus nasutitermitis]GGD51934.1 hypothetical protein GCM10010911_06890 [Paenibacillus nasutitermitis]
MPAYKKSIQKKALKNAHFEAFSSTVFINLLQGPYLTGYLLYLGANAGQIGMIMSIPLVMNAFIVISAFFMEKYTNRYRISFIAILIHRSLLSACGLIPFVVPKEWWVPVFLILYSVLSFSGSFSSVPFTTLFTDLVPTKVRAKYLGHRFTLSGIAAAITMLTAGWLLERLNQSAGFALLFIIGFLIAIINITFIGKYPNLPHIPSENGLSLQHLLIPFRDSSFIKSIMFVSIWIMAQGSTISLFSYVMLDIMKINYEWLGISNTLLAIVSIVAFSIWGKLSIKWGARKLLLWVFPLNALSIIFWGLQDFTPVSVMLIVVYSFLGISMAGFGLLVFNFVVSHAPKRDLPIYFAVYASLTGLFGFFGPLIGGLIFDHIKTWPLWYQEYGLLVCIGFLMLLGSLTLAFRIFNVSRVPKSIKNSEP